MCEQSTAYNTYATMSNTNPQFMGFSRSQNVNKEIISFSWKALFYKGFKELHLENDVYLMFNR